VTRFFGSLCRGCDKLADLFFITGMVGPSREKRLITRFFRFRLSGLRQISRYIFFYLFHLDGWSESRKAPNNSIFSVQLFRGATN